MRVGTWNLAGRWSDSHEHLIRQQECGVWLLTEVSERLALDGYVQHSTAACMAPQRRWAAILSSEPLTGLPDPHPASALAKIGNVLFCSSILPWRSCGGQTPWVGVRHAERTEAALESLLRHLPQSGLVWGGDWNHALSGPEYAGSKGGRAHILNGIDLLKLKVPTEPMRHRIRELLTIDHIAVGQAVTVVSAEQIDASKDGRRLSDHDAYVVEIK